MVVEEEESPAVEARRIGQFEEKGNFECQREATISGFFSSSHKASIPASSIRLHNDFVLPCCGGLSKGEIEARSPTPGVEEGVDETLVRFASVKGVAVAVVAMSGEEEEVPDVAPLASFRPNPPSSRRVRAGPSNPVSLLTSIPSSRM